MEAKETMGGGQQGGESRNDGGALRPAASRHYRRGNWTVPETMVLIEAKRKVHEERHPGEQGLARWQWVEDYCWHAGCWRSQNQCNDRWDNLMRDYKKVRAHELARGAGAGEVMSYWAMGRAERKDRGLPSNLLREIYDAMTEVVERKAVNTAGCSGAAAAGGGAFFPAAASSGLLDVPMQASPLAQVLPPAMPHQPLEQVTCGYGHVVLHYRRSESPVRKRRRPSSLDERPPESSSTPASGTPHFHRQEYGGDESSDDDEEEEVLGGAIGRCVAVLSEALESREAAEERRHREVMAAEESRDRAVQARREAGEQCVSGLASAVNQLAGSMLALAAAKHKGGGPAAPK